MEYKKMLKVMEAVKDYGTENIADCEIVYINEKKKLKVKNIPTPKHFGGDIFNKINFSQ